MSNGHDPGVGVHGLPVDPDTSATSSSPRPQVGAVLRGRGDILLAIAVGGALGSLARWSLAEALPHGPDDFVWSTFTANVTGALALGMLMALMVDVLAHTRLIRPFLGVGVLGGYTTFSTYMLDARTLLAEGRAWVALAYVAATLVTGLLAVWVGVVAGRSAVRLAGRRALRRHGHEIGESTPAGPEPSGAPRETRSEP